MKRIALHTLGCKLNFAETATLGRQFAERGFTSVGIDDRAEVVLINTCSVTERADRECRQLVRRALRHSPQAYVIVTGCYAQLRPEEISAIKGVDLVLGTKEKFNVFDFVDDWSKTGHARKFVSSTEEIIDFHGALSSGFADRTRAFLKIQDGCDYTCSFCTIPLARGESRSALPDQSTAQVIKAVLQGYKEIVLTGVNVGDYGRKEGTNLLSFLRNIVAVDGLERIRVSSIEPNLLTDELLEFWISHPKLCNHFHIPLQSGSEDVLKMMRRRYQPPLYRNRIEAIKSACPTAGIGADVIVGFPGETEKEFQETYDFLLDIPVSYFHVFTFSERPNTSAAVFANVVEPKVRAERSERLRQLGFRKRRMFHESFLKKTVSVLFEEDRNNGSSTGLTPEYVRVNVPSRRNLTNQILPVQITNAQSDSCWGELMFTSSAGEVIAA